MKKDLGFTLVELMVTLSVLVVLLGLGVPGLRGTIEGSRITAAANDLATALQFARSEAVKRGSNVVLCAASDQDTCSGTWSGGWVARTTNEALRVWPSTRQGITIAAAGSVEFNPLGGTTAARCFEITLNGLQRFVGVGPAGRVASSSTACP